MADQLEIEQKFDVDEDFQRPDFGALGEVLDDGVTAAAPVLHHLAATYFDTPDERLAAHKITLRRRTGGTDAGWHLKLPAGLDARRELHEPLDAAGEVPARLAATVAEVTGGLPLAPIAVLDTERTVVTLTARDGRVLAEVADDLVTARRLGATRPRPAAALAGGRGRGADRGAGAAAGGGGPAARGGRPPAGPRLQARAPAEPMSAHWRQARILRGNPYLIHTSRSSLACHPERESTATRAIDE